jgi:bla regulator protein blaR1
MMRILSEIVVMLSASAVMPLMIEGTAVVALGLMSARLARRGRAAVRHALLASVFGIVLTLPVVSLIAPPVTISVPVAAKDSGILPLFDFNPLPPLGQSASAHLGAAAQPGLPLRSPAAMSLSSILLCGWLAGMALFAIPVIRGLLQIRSLRRFGLPWQHGQAVAEGLAPRRRREVEVLVHESLPGPMTCGVLRPVVMLPEDARSWDEKDLERALVHELEHVRRYDWAIHCLARVACVAYWFHPLVWAAWRQLTLEAERSCDDAEATAYADQLLGLARRRSTVRRSPALAMANRSDLASRIGALLDQNQSRGPVSASLVAACGVAVAIVLTVAPLRVVAAPQSAANPTFEVASVKLHLGGADRNTLAPPTVLPGGRFVSRFPLAILISFAYKLPSNPSMVTGIPDWTKSPQGVYDVEAKGAIPPGLSMQARNDRVRAMVQALLVDRFKLVIRREPKEMPVYALLVAKGGPKLQRADIDENDCPEASPNVLGPQTTYTPMPDVCHVFNGGVGRGLHARAANMSDLAAFVGNWTDRPLLDKTGIQGLYRFETGPYQRMDVMAGSHVPDAPTVFEMFRQLGLRMEPQKSVVEVYVIDHIERPSEN